MADVLCTILSRKDFMNRTSIVTVQPSNIPRGVTLHSQRDPEICGRQTAEIAACVHAFVTVKPEG